MRNYTGITFSTRDTKNCDQMQNLIPADHRPVLVFWAITDDINAFYLKKIKADKHFWTPVRLEKRDEYVLVVSRVDGTSWTHDEVLSFLREHEAPEGVRVMPLSDDELLQTAMRHNVLRGRSWDYDLPE